MTTRPASANGFAPADVLPLDQFIRFRDLIEDRCGLHFAGSVDAFSTQR